MNIVVSPEPSEFLNIDMEWQRANNLVILRQTRHIEKLARKFDIDEGRDVKIPMDVTKKLQPRKEDEQISLKPYRELIRALIYISTCTRPDIAYAVNRHAQFFASYTDNHFETAKKILMYLSATKHFGLHLGGRKDLNFKVYVDADFANEEESRLSVTGNIIFIGDSLISWTSKRQKLVATSSTEAEFLAVFYSLRDIQYLDQFVKCVFPEINFNITLYQDNQSTIALIKNQSSKGRTKHFDVKLRAVNNAYIEQFFILEYCPTQ